MAKLWSRLMGDSPEPIIRIVSLVALILLVLSVLGTIISPRQIFVTLGMPSIVLVASGMIAMAIMSTKREQ